LTKRSGRLPTQLEIAERSRQLDQVITLVVFLLSAAFLSTIVYSSIDLDLGDGFPVESWSATWISGSTALVAIAIVAGRILWSWTSHGRVPARK
jgi:NhaP-type Na+/H+ or K+/H+ antiporter